MYITLPGSGLASLLQWELPLLPHAVCHPGTPLVERIYPRKSIVDPPFPAPARLSSVSTTVPSSLGLTSPLAWKDVNETTSFMRWAIKGCKRDETDTQTLLSWAICSAGGLGGLKGYDDTSFADVRSKMASRPGKWTVRNRGPLFHILVNFKNAHISEDITRGYNSRRKDTASAQLKSRHPYLVLERWSVRVVLSNFWLHKCVQLWNIRSLL